MDITLIILAAITLLMGIVIALVPSIRAKLNAQQWELLCKLAYTGVMAVQQIYKNLPSSEELQRKKFEEVKEWLRVHNLKVSGEDIEKAIEAAVIRMKQELATSQKQI